MRKIRKIAILKSRKGFLTWPIILAFLLILIWIAAVYIKPMLERIDDTKGKYIDPDVSTEEGMYKVIKSYASVDQKKYSQAIELATEFINTEKYANSKYMSEVFYFLFYSQVQSPDYPGAKDTIKQYIKLKYKGVVPTSKIKNSEISFALFQMAVGTGTDYGQLFTGTGYLNRPDPLFEKANQQIKWPGFEDDSKYAGTIANPYYFGWYLYVIQKKCDQDLIGKLLVNTHIYKDESLDIDQLLTQIQRSCPNSDVSKITTI